MQIQPDLRRFLENLTAAQNEHDLEAFVDFFDPDYQSDQPAHPDRFFRGRDQVRKNWSAIFNSIPDFCSELLGVSQEGDTVWSEWRWSGTNADGSGFEMVGITIFGIRDERIAWGRLYMEEVEIGAGIDATVSDLTHGSH